MVLGVNKTMICIIILICLETGGGFYLLGVQCLACVVIMCWAVFTTFTLLTVSFVKTRIHRATFVCCNLLREPKLRVQNTLVHCTMLIYNRKIVDLFESHLLKK